MPITVMSGKVCWLAPIVTLQPSVVGRIRRTGRPPLFMISTETNDRVARTTRVSGHLREGIRGSAQDNIILNADIKTTITSIKVQVTEFLFYLHQDV